MLSDTGLLDNDLYTIIYNAFKNETKITLKLNTNTVNSDILFVRDYQIKDTVSMYIPYSRVDSIEIIDYEEV